MVQIRLPPLRERGGDVLLLAAHFLERFGVSMNKTTRTISSAARQKLAEHHWPGNVRELRNVIERALILETSREIQAGNLPDFQLESRLGKSAQPRLASQGSLEELMTAFERELVTSTLAQNRFNLNRSAEQLKITRHALRYRMHRLNISPVAEIEDEPADPVGKEKTP